MAITVTEVRNLTFYTTSQVSDSQIQSYLDYVEGMINQDLGNIFTTTTITEADCYNYETNNTHGSLVISIGAWQESGLSVKRIDIEDKHNTAPADNTLTLGTDYVLHYAINNQKIPTVTNPVTAIELISWGLHRHELLRVWGTYGWGNDYPSDVKYMIIQLVGDLLGYALSKSRYGGAGVAKSEKDLTSQVTYELPSANNLRDYLLNIYSNPSYQDILLKYRMLTQNSLTVL